MQPLFLDIEQVLQIHRSLIEQYGGSVGLRDAGLLHSALAMPQASFSGELLHKDPFEMAAAYFYHLVQNHAFIDGNKRVGAATAIVFLTMNEIEIEADENGLVELTLAVAKGEIGKQEIAAYFRDKNRRMSQ
jgi:death-on-curing protein